MIITHKKLFVKQASLVNRKGPILLHDNARPHVSQITIRKVHELGYETLMLYSKLHLPQHLWAESMNYAVYVLSRTGPTKVIGKTPYELWFGKRPSVDYL
ncbi:Histone-lysine N-methyltransferase SETMAR [Habropoda laboriosa]|uniref:Histone-lysine N-methyltransferase SETMAR n=1 Tax=Habropoda laboriosa TaxID=597456 RepID=A0A0L7QZQ5_9HYME|nr:Histone-lysine N-methyltransferase SETMAR [Habropoda laboriosa]